MKFILSFALLLSAITGFSQGKNSVPAHLLETYYSKEIQPGKVSASLFDSLQMADRQHPSAFFMVCGNFYQERMFNEAAIAYYLGVNRYRLYNATNPDYEENTDGALLGSLFYSFYDPVMEYLNKNLDNHAAVLNISHDWYKANRPADAKSGKGKKIFEDQLSQLLKASKELQDNPMVLINQLEVESMMEGIESFEDESTELENLEAEIQEKEKNNNPTSEVPGAFLMNLSGEPHHLWIDSLNEIYAVAHGYFDTYLECAEAEIVQQSNSLYYTVKPTQKGICTIKLYGVTEKGLKVQLASYQFIAVPAPSKPSK